MTGQIPKYGKHFRRESVVYSPHRAGRVYVLRANPDLFIQSNKTSSQWHLMVGRIHGVSYPIGKTQDTMRDAMALALSVHAALEGK